MSYLGEKSYCCIEFRNEVLEMCFPSIYTIYTIVYTPRYLTLVVVFIFCPLITLKFMCFVTIICLCLNIILVLLAFNEILFLLSHWFADDTNIMQSNKSLDVLSKNLNKDLKNLSQWLKANILSLNISKTELIIFHRNTASIVHSLQT